MSHKNNLRVGEKLDELFSVSVVDSEASRS